MSKLKYGIVLGKFSKCWHLGHQSIVDAVRADGLEPIIFIGSAQHYDTPSCPLHVFDRMEMIELTNPDIKMILLEDQDCWTKWHKTLLKKIKKQVSKKLAQVTIYTHNKPEDLQDFTFKKVDYYNEYYSKIFEVEGLHTTNLPISDIVIRGTKIHEDLEGNKNFLDPKVYEYLKGLK